MIAREVPTYSAAIYIAGDPARARAVCCRHVQAVGLCVTVEPVQYIYTGGEEQGVRVGLINYPRFPSSPDAIFASARALAEALLEALGQWSVSIVASDRTVWLSRRPSDVCEP